MGGGGLGDLAIKYGYYRFQVDVMTASVIILILIVVVMQTASNILYKKLR